MSRIHYARLKKVAKPDLPSMMMRKAWLEEISFSFKAECSKPSHSTIVLLNLPTDRAEEKFKT